MATKKKTKTASKKAKRRYVYFFGDGKADGAGNMKPLLGGKGANLAEMTRIGLPVPPGAARVGRLPVAGEAAVSYRTGTARGPAAILTASAQVDLFDRETGRPYEQGIAMLPIPKTVAAWNRAARKLATPIIRAGGAGKNKTLIKQLAQVNGLCDKMNDWVYETATHWLAQGKRVGLVGGDHSTPFGLIRAILEK